MLEHLRPGHLINDHLGGGELIASHDLTLVALSFLISFVAAYTALTTVVNARSTANRQLWLVLGAISYGFGVWAMHFTGMSAMRIGTLVHYDLAITLLSVVFAIVGAYAAFRLISRRRAGPALVLASGVSLGGGIGAMHYTGMFAIRANAQMSFQLGIVALSVLVAVGIGTLGMWLLLRYARPNEVGRNILIAAVVGAAIPLMHYTAMGATVFRDISTAGVSLQQGAISLNGLMVIAIVGIAVPLFTAALVRTPRAPSALQRG